jgi:uncharacterized membrane protein
MAPPLLHLLGLNSLASAMFSIYSKACHQIASRSFFIVGIQCGFCARCTGFYGGLLAGSLHVTLRKSGRGPAAIWVLLFSLATLIDVVFSLSPETLGGNWFRLLLALPTGFLLAWWALAKLRVKPRATN